MGLTFLGSSKGHVVQEVGVLTPKPVPVEELCAGEVGYLTANIRDPRDVLAGETITETARPARTALPGFRRLKPMVFAGIYPANTQELGTLRVAMDKLLLNDAAFQFAPEQSDALGQGFRCGFLGLLHMEIVQERLEREFGVDLVLTTPSVAYQAKLTDGRVIDIDSPSKWPASHDVAELLEPYVKAVLLAPATCLGLLMDVVKQERGVHRSTEFLSETRVKLV